MVDLVDLSTTVMKYEADGRHGLAQLERYRVLRKGGHTSIPTNTLAYFDVLAATFLDAAADSTRDMLAVVRDSKLGLVRPRRGRPDANSTPYLDDGKITRTQAYKAALYRAELLATGKSSAEAYKQARELYGYPTNREIRRIESKHGKAIEHEVQQQATQGRFNELHQKFARIFDLEAELINACRTVTSSTPQTHIVLLSDRDDCAVTFPPTRESLWKLLPKLCKKDLEDPTREIAWICIAGECNTSVTKARTAFSGWPVDDMLAFVEAALQHLKRLSQDQ